MRKRSSILLVLLVLVPLELQAQPPVVATATEAKAFLDEAETTLLRLWIDSQRAGWVQENFITDDTEILAAQANDLATAKGVEYAKAAARFNDADLPPDIRRKLDLLKLALVLPAPANDAERAELTRLSASLSSAYGKGKYCPSGPDSCRDLEQLSNTLAESRDPKVLLDAWSGWHTISPPMKKDYQRLVELANRGAKELGYRDLGVMWRSKYDMPPDAFAAELDRLFEQVKPLYLSLHAYVRMKLREKYGEAVVPKNGPIPAHLLGNMWMQDWANIYDLLEPKDADPGYNLTQLLQAKKVDEKQMVRYGEGFFSSLGFPALPKTFWERSLFTKPKDREVVCHASAWDIDWVDDLRIKMCIEINEEDFETIHHELGHNYYQRAYAGQPVLFRDSANDGFHEAIGDAIALSVTPKYLVQLGFLEKEPPASKDIGLLLKLALSKVAFLPFGLTIDKWRWQVFSGEVDPAHYNQAWWDLKLKYQGVASPIPRSEKDFDPGAKYHVPASTPYMRYFLADILQFQMHRALCAKAGNRGALNRCSIYGSAEAGKALSDMLAMGVSQPWPDALEAVTGQKQMDATAMIDYFAPLKVWLDEQTKSEKKGW